jgi:cell filamentation protein
MGNDPVVLAKKPGVVMGQFAWGHPFLDGNGRTMLIVHTELCEVDPKVRTDLMAV